MQVATGQWLRDSMGRNQKPFLSGFQRGFFLIYSCKILARYMPYKRSNVKFPVGNWSSTLLSQRGKEKRVWAERRLQSGDLGRADAGWGREWVCGRSRVVKAPKCRNSHSTSITLPCLHATETHTSSMVAKALMWPLRPWSMARPNWDVT